MIPGLFFTFGLVALLLVVNALRRPVPPSHRFPPLWLFGMIASEAAGTWLALMPLVTVAAVTAGALRSPVGGLGLALATVAFVGQIEVWRRGRVGARRVGPPVDLPPGRVARLLSWPRTLSPEVVRKEHVFADNPYGSSPLRLDLYRRQGTDTSLPLAVWLHGGGWRGGHRRQSGLTIIDHLARCGWAVAAIDYPLSPGATFPEHLYGIDAALEWAGRQPYHDGTVVLMGASAGAHLAAVAAATRPGIDGLVTLYGIYDFLNRNRTRHDWPLIPHVVMKARPSEDPERYRLASPIDLADAGGPPTLLVSPGYDSLVPPPEAGYFAAALEAAGTEVTVLEVLWAQHGFDTFAGPRTRSVAGAIARWMEPIRRGEHRQRKSAQRREGD